MKFLQKLLFIPFLAFLISGCEEDLEKTQINSEITGSTLSELSAAAYALTFETQDQAFDEFSWTATDFGFEALVTYTLQMDIVSDFEAAVTLSEGRSLSASPSEADINEALLGFGVSAGEAAEVYFRIKSTVSANLDPVYSNSITSMVTPFSTAFPPIYIIGDAATGWDLTKAVKLVSTGPGVYEGYSQFQAGHFRFFETPSWDASQWGFSYFSGGTPASLDDAADSDSNFDFVGTAGIYKITVSLTNKSIAMEESAFPTLYIIGDAQGWNLANAFKLTFVAIGEFEGTTNFQNAGKFRFFEIADWNAVQYKADFFEGGVPTEFTNPMDNDNNFLFDGSTGSYHVIVNLNDKTVSY